MIPKNWMILYANPNASWIARNGADPEELERPSG